MSKTQDNNPRADESELLFNLIRSNEINTIKEMIQTYPDLINAQDGNGNTPLHIATQTDDGLDIAELFIKSGANINAQCNYGYTPLYNAVINPRDNTALTTLLITNGADVNVQANELKTTPLLQAICKTNTNITSILIQNGADVNAQNHRGDTPLHCSVRSGGENIISILIAEGANINTKNTLGKTPLSLCITYAGSDIDLRGEVMTYLPKIAKLLIREGADISLVEGYQTLPMLHDFCKKQQAKELAALYSNKCFEYNNDEAKNSSAGFLWQKLPIDILQQVSEYVEILDLNRVVAITKFAILHSTHGPKTRDHESEVTHSNTTTDITDVIPSAVEVLGSDINSISDI